MTLYEVKIDMSGIVRFHEVEVQEKQNTYVANDWNDTFGYWKVMNKSNIGRIRDKFEVAVTGTSRAVCVSAMKSYLQKKIAACRAEIDIAERNCEQLDSLNGENEKELESGT